MIGIIVIGLILLLLFASSSSLSSAGGGLGAAMRKFKEGLGVDDKPADKDGSGGK